MQQDSLLETYDQKGNIKVIERFFDVPLDYANPTRGTIKIFARNLIPKDKAPTEAKQSQLPYFLYLQGGPGFEVALPNSSGFAGEIHQRGYQTLWLDQRGTGLSAPISADTLDSFPTDKEKAEYFKHFRADSIVKDCEHIRKALIGTKEDPEDRKWTILGQSFGGFCAITYLSFHSEGLKEVFLTGGLAPILNHPDDVYGALIKNVKQRNKIYYGKYPRDIQRVREIATFLNDNVVTLPNGGRLTVRRWQQLGFNLGMHGGIDDIHQIVLRAANDLSLFRKFAYKTLQTIQEKQSFDGNPIYAVLHEPLYCQGFASDWSAQRIVSQHSDFLWETVKASSDKTPLFFTGEMIFPDMFDDYANLKPLKGVANILAGDATWGPLYDVDQLSKNEVKVSAATFVEDMYVEFSLAQVTATKIRNTEQYITNQLLHNAIRNDAKDVMEHLFRISRRERD